MATIDIHDLSGKKVGTFDLSDEIFGAVNEDLLWEAVKHYRAGQHRGTHATKARWQVSGSGKKLWKQKGTGRARIGSIRSIRSNSSLTSLRRRCRVARDRQPQNSANSAHITPPSKCPSGGVGVADVSSFEVAGDNARLALG